MTRPLEEAFAEVYRNEMRRLRASNPKTAEDWARAAVSLANSMLPHYEVAVRTAIAAMLGTQLRPRHKGVEKRAAGTITQDISRTLARRVAATVETTRDAIESILAEAAADNLDADEIRDLIDEEWSDVLGRRAELIATTEVNGAVNSARDYVLREVVDTARWVTAADERVRPTHVIYGEAGAKPTGFDWASLVRGTDYHLLFPGDPDCDEPGEIINCFLPGTRVVGDVIALSKARYSGPARILETASGARLAVTANHPVLTHRGWLAAHEVREGDELLADRRHVHRAVHGDVDDQEGAARVEDLFDALAANGRPRAVVVGALDLHGEGDFVAGKVEVASVESLGLGDGDPLLAEDGRKLGHVSFVAPTPALASERAASQLGGTGLSAPAGVVRGLDLGSAPPPAHLRPLQPLRIGAPPRLDPVLAKHAADCAPGDPEAFRELERGCPGEVTADRVVRVIATTHDGPVYDVQTATGLVHAGEGSTKLIAHNCRCFLLPDEPVEMSPEQLAGFLDDFGMTRDDLQAQEEMDAQWIENPYRAAPLIVVKHLPGQHDQSEHGNREGGDEGKHEPTRLDVESEKLGADLEGGADLSLAQVQHRLDMLREIAGTGEGPHDPVFIMGAQQYTSKVNGYLKRAGARDYEGSPLPPDVERGPLGECYENATKLVLRDPDRFQYCEGIAYRPNTLGIAYMHGWCIDKKTGEVVDPTWDDSARCSYYGVTYPNEEYIAHIARTRVYGVLGGAADAAQRVIETGKLETPRRRRAKR